MPDDKDEGSSALFYRDEHGRKRDDGLHQEEPADPHAYHEASMQRAMKRGATREEAFADCGPKGVTLEEHDAEMASRRGRGNRISPRQHDREDFDEAMRDR